MRRHQLDLELRAGQYLAGVLQPFEHGIGLSGDVGIEQIVETHVTRPVTRCERVALAPGAARMHAKEFAGLPEGRIFGEHRLEPGDPIPALAGLAIRNSLDPRSERGTDALEYLCGIRHRHAADEMDVPAGQGSLHGAST